MSEMDPADRRMFEVSAEQYDALEAALARPAVRRARLAAFLAEESPFTATDSTDREGETQ